MRTRTTTILARLLAALVALLLAATCVGSALAEEIEPDESVVLGRLYDTGSKNFANPGSFYLDLLNAKIPTDTSLDLKARDLDSVDYSMGQRWLQLAVGLTEPYQKGWHEFNDGSVANAIESALNSSEPVGVEDDAQQGSKVFFTGFVRGNSIEDALAAMKTTYQKADLNDLVNFDHNSRFSDYQKAQDVVAGSIVIEGTCVMNDDSKPPCAQTIEVYFTNFELVALLPSAEGSDEGGPTPRGGTVAGAYTINDDSNTVDLIKASDIRNVTGTPVTAEVSLPNAWTSTVDSAIENAGKHRLADAIQVGKPYHFMAETIFPEKYTALDAFKNGWNGGEPKDFSKDEGHTVSVNLPPYTNVLLEQKYDSHDVETTFDCPVALKYEVRLYSHIGVLETNPNMPDPVTKIMKFGPDARADLEEKADSRELSDVDGKVIAAIVNHVPMAKVPASFTETVLGESGEFVDIVPTLPLASVKLVPPSNLAFIIDGEFSYGKLNYMHADMELDESSFTDLLTVQGYNAEGAEYYGFNQSKGHWIVTDKDGKELTDAPIKLEGNKYTAVKPGTCYLRYVIDENTYPDFKSSDDLADVFYGKENGKEEWNQFVKNDDLTATAALEITVKGDLYTMNVSGSFNGYVNRAPEKLEKDGGLVVSVIDNKTGAEIADITYVWQKMELDSRGIKLEEDGTVSFTKSGDYHVRAINKDEGLVSDWVVIHADDKAPVTITEAPVAAAITYGQTLNDSALTGGKAVQTDTEEAVEGTFTWKNTDVQPNVADSDVTAYEVVFTPNDADLYQQATCSATLTVNPAPAKVEAAPKARALIYNGQSQTLVNPGKADGGVMWYALGDDDENAPVFDGNAASGVWSMNPPSGVDADVYNVWYIVDADANHIDTDAKCIPVVINNQPTDPEAPLRGTLVYNSQRQELVKPGSVVGGQLQYYLGDTAPEKEEDWTREIPSAIDAGTYHVWYRVKGDKNHNDTVPAALEVTISPKPLYVKALNAGKIHGEVDPELTYEVTGLVGMDRMYGKLTREAGEKVGTYAISQGSLTAKGNYAIDFDGATFTIDPEPPLPVKPDFTLLAKAAPSGKKIVKLTWTKVEGAQGYDVFFKKCDGDESYPLYKSVKGTSCKIKKLKKGICYKAYVHAWRREGTKKVYIGDGSPVVHCITGGFNRTRTNVKSVTLDKTSINLVKGQSSALTATVKKLKGKRKILNHEKAVRYLSTNANVAKVDQNGAVTGVSAGTCTIYAISPNGVRASAQVTVTADD